MSKRRTQATAATVEPTIEPTLEAAVASTLPLVLVHPGPLTDVAQQTQMFEGLAPGRYIIEYQPQPNTVMPVSVYWTGTMLVA